ncbi:AraC family transcriptional regulator ligand-binding domain-containing protein [Actinacidiphila acidipaludis]|uniref:AraC family transcriptional regulator ligand-binding domain-containing protein n=1 Tax=Actinacidiphila acidipaludis TaxID=2873382 RepID=A0ABS7QDN1_9ACTN|nr:AraC family transcriptional regulator ligand-binding domain-containing protein [Streptomyces acidipaludis]MBY8881232.1 AraC family transcriptional regulator ligand-binding domain-containing protein [Streptomyces acidipaludis]
MLPAEPIDDSPGASGPWQDDPVPVPVYTESVVVPRFIATASSRGEEEAERLVRAAGMPRALTAPETARTPSPNTYRLWAEVLARTGRTDAGLLAAGAYRPGRLDLFDYLLLTASTLGEGLAQVGANIHLVSSNSLLTTEESGDEVTVTYAVRHGDDRLRAVVAEFSLAVVTAQVRHATGSAFAPRRVTFAHRAPAHSAAHRAAFGAADLQFGAERDAFTLHRRDLERPLVTADPALAAIIRRTAASLPAPREARPQAVPGLREVIAGQLPDGRPSLAEAARQLSVSPRTLQRRLGASGTTWRAELDAVRRDQAAGLHALETGPEARAARLGFAESRSLRRAMHRWDAARGREDAGRAGPGQDGERRHDRGRPEGQAEAS